MSEDRLSGTSASLLPGTGYTPNYGISDDHENDTTHSGFTHSTKSSVSLQLAGGKERLYVVARCALIACLASLISGMSSGFTSPALAQLQQNELFVSGNDTTHSSLFGSFAAIGAMFGGLFAWPISDFLGRQAALIVGGVPFLCGWLMLANAVQITGNGVGFLAVLLLGRVLVGFATGWSIFCASVYITEISSPKLKGMFGNCNQLLVTIGILLSYLLGIKFGNYRMPYYNIALVAAGIVVLFEILMLFTYKTPRWLFSKNMEYDGIRVLKILRGPQFQIAKEINSIKIALRRTYSIKEQLLEFKNRAVYHPLILILFLMFFQQFSGINVAVFYASSVFKDVGYDPDTANLVTLIAVGVTQVIATFISVLLVDYLGRRILLIVSSIGMLASTFMLGIYFLVKDLEKKDTPQHFEYLAIVGVALLMISFSLGWGPIPWSSMSELLPSQVRTLGASIATFANWGFATIITFAFKPYSSLVTIKFTWWTFSLVMLISIIFVLLFLPETKGKSLEEIQSHFEKGKIIACSCKCQSTREIAMEATSGIGTINI